MKQPRIDLKLNEIQTLTGRLTKSKVDDVNDALLRMLVSKVLPISLVENEDFQRFCGLLEPRLVILTTRSLPLCFCRENVVCFNVCCIYSSAFKARFFSLKQTIWTLISLI